MYVGGGVGAEIGGGGGYSGRNFGNFIYWFGKEGDFIVYKIFVIFGKVIRYLVYIFVKIRLKWKWYGELFSFILENFIRYLENNIFFKLL